MHLPGAVQTEAQPEPVLVFRKPGFVLLSQGRAVGGGEKDVVLFSFFRPGPFADTPDKRHTQERFPADEIELQFGKRILFGKTVKNDLIQARFIDDTPLLGVLVAVNTVQVAIFGNLQHDGFSLYGLDSETHGNSHHKYSPIPSYFKGITTT